VDEFSKVEETFKSAGYLLILRRCSKVEARLYSGENVLSGGYIIKSRRSSKVDEIF